MELSLSALRVSCVSCALAATPARAAVAKVAELIPRKLLREGCSIIDRSFEGSVISFLPRVLLDTTAIRRIDRAGSSESIMCNRYSKSLKQKNPFSLSVRAIDRQLSKQRRPQADMSSRAAATFRSHAH